MINGVPLLLDKIKQYRPRIVCFVGKGIWDVFVKEATKITASAVKTEPEPTSTPSPSSSRVQTPAQDDQTPDVLPSPAVPTPRRGKAKAKRSVKGKVVFAWGIQPIRVVHDSDHGEHSISSPIGV